MRLSTSTNVYFNRPGGKKAAIEDSVRLCAQAGYRVMDMNFYDCTTFRLPFVSEYWKEWIYSSGIPVRWNFPAAAAKSGWKRR